MRLFFSNRHVHVFPAPFHCLATDKYLKIASTDSKPAECDTLSLPFPEALFVAVTEAEPQFPPDFAAKRIPGNGGNQGMNAQEVQFDPCSSDCRTPSARTLAALPRISQHTSGLSIRHRTSLARSLLSQEAVRALAMASPIPSLHTTLPNSTVYLRIRRLLKERKRPSPKS